MIIAFNAQYNDMFHSSCIIILMQGDSGGPVTFMSGDQHILIGAVSFGSKKGCGLEMGSAHCRISNVRAWIDLNTLDAVFCGDNPHADKF